MLSHSESFRSARLNQPYLHSLNQLQTNIATSLVQDVVLSTLKEMVLSTLMTAITCCFLAHSAIPVIIATTVTMIAINSLVRGLTAYQKYKLHQLEQQHHPVHNGNIAFLKKTICLGQWLCPANFAYFDQLTSAMLVHEAGHAAAAVAVYQHAHPRIEILPGGGGLTSYRAGALTRLGKYLGKKNSNLCIAAAGPAFSIITAIAQIALSHKLKKDHPEAAKYLLAAGISNIASHIIYALSALLQKHKNPGHDFLQLWKVGNIHPVVSIISMVALPVLVKGILVATSIS